MRDTTPHSPIYPPLILSQAKPKEENKNTGGQHHPTPHPSPPRGGNDYLGPAEDTSPPPPPEDYPPHAPEDTSPSPPPEYEEPPHDEQQPPHDEHQPQHDEQQPKHDEQEPQHDEQQPQHDEQQPIHDEQEPQHDEHQPQPHEPPPDHTPAAEDSQPPTEDTPQPPAEGEQPPLPEHTPQPPDVEIDIEPQSHPQPPPTAAASPSNYQKEEEDVIQSPFKDPASYYPVDVEAKPDPSQDGGSVDVADTDNVDTGVADGQVKGETEDEKLNKILVEHNGTEIVLEVKGQPLKHVHKGGDKPIKLILPHEAMPEYQNMNNDKSKEDKEFFNYLKERYDKKERDKDKEKGITENKITDKDKKEGKEISTESTGAETAKG